MIKIKDDKYLMMKRVYNKATTRANNIMREA
jgi:hypothetical protein